MTRDFAALLTFLDLETTGLASDDIVIEAGWTTLAITQQGHVEFPLGDHRQYYEEMDTSSWSGSVCVEDPARPTGRVAALYEGLRKKDSFDGIMDPYVYGMHLDTGLLADWHDDHVAGETVTLQQLGERWSAMLDTYPEAHAVHVAGAGVSAFDWPRLKAVLPDVMNRFHYRPIDVSPSRTIFQWSHPGSYLNPDEPSLASLEKYDQSLTSAPKLHRAKYDVLIAVQQFDRIFSIMGGLE